MAQKIFVPYISQISLVLILHCLHLPLPHPSLLQLLLLVLDVYSLQAVFQTSVLFAPQGLKFFLRWHLIFKNNYVHFTKASRKRQKAHVWN